MVTPQLTGVSASTDDFVVNTTPLTFNGTAGETQTFSVMTVQDAVVEEDETYAVALTISATTVSVSTPETATGTIINDDTAILTIGDASAIEGDAMTFEVTLGNNVQNGLSLPQPSPMVQLLERTTSPTLLYWPFLVRQMRY